MNDRFPSEQFRKDLADELRAIRKNDPRVAHMILSEKKSTVSYHLAEKLVRQRRKGHLPVQREMREEDNPYEEIPNRVYPNEASLFEIFEYIKNIEGAGLGVGMDQMLDIAVNSKLSEITIVDITKKAALTTQTLLEAGRRFHLLHGRYPLPNEYVELFSRESIDLTFEMLAPNFTEEEWTLVEETLYQAFKTGPTIMQSILQDKSTQTDYRSWVSTPQNLEKIIRMYEDGSIKIVRADLAGKQGMRDIAQQLQEHHTPLSLLYLSNTITYFTLAVKGEKYEERMGSILSFFDNVDILPLSDSAVVVQTCDFTGTNVTVPVPARLTSDPNLKHIYYKEWGYFVQSAQGYRTFMSEIRERPDIDPQSAFFSHFVTAQRNKTLHCYKPGVFLLDYTVSSPTQ